MTFANTITVGPEFFAKAKNDYSDWRWAIVREFMQNSIDCGSSRIDAELGHDGANTRLVITNNGDPMSEQILRDNKDSLQNAIAYLDSSGFGNGE